MVTSCVSRYSHVSGKRATPAAHLKDQEDNLELIRRLEVESGRRFASKQSCVLEKSKSTLVIHFGMGSKLIAVIIVLEGIARFDL